MGFKKVSRKRSLTEEEEDQLVEEVIRRYKLMSIVDQESGRVGLVMWDDKTNTFKDVSQDELLKLVGTVMAEKYGNTRGEQ